MPLEHGLTSNKWRNDGERGRIGGGRTYGRSGRWNGVKVN